MTVARILPLALRVGAVAATAYTAWTLRRAVTRGDLPATKDGGEAVEFDAVVRIDTPGEADYYRNGGILQYVLRNMLRSGSEA